jgi:two-component system, chemotaxis family, chemotaxis protein CheY
MRVLIVDDCELSRQFLILAVEAFSEIDTAENGAEAIQLAKQAIDNNDNYNLICVDLSMPMMDGHETMQAIRKMESDANVARAVVFMVTASSCPDDMLQAITHGECDDYLLKPVKQKTFRELLKKHNLIK